MTMKIILMIVHLIAFVACAISAVWCWINRTEALHIILSGVTALCWLGCLIMDIQDLVERKQR